MAATDELRLILKEQGLDCHGRNYKDDFISVIMPLFRDRWTDPVLHGTGIGNHSTVDDFRLGPPNLCFQQALPNPTIGMYWVMTKQLTLDAELPPPSVRPRIINDRWLSSPSSSGPTRLVNTVLNLNQQAFHRRQYAIAREVLQSTTGVSDDTSIPLWLQDDENIYNSSCPDIYQARRNPRSLQYTRTPNTPGIDGIDFVTQFIANVASAGFAFAVGAAGQYLFHRRGQVYHTFNSVSDSLRRTWNTRPFRSSSGDNLRSRFTVDDTDETWEMVSMSGVLGVNRRTMDTITGESRAVAERETRANRTRQTRRNSL
jgi:hypothetical protein